MTNPAILLVAVVLTAAVPAQEWSRFRGPGGQGVGKAPDLPVTLTAADVRWQVELGGVGHSSPVLWGDKLFLTRTTKAAGVRELVCIDATSGAERWATRCEFEPHRQHSFNSFASATPAVDADGVYLVWSSGAQLVAVAFDHAGKRRWRRALGAFQAQHGSGSSPILVGDLVVIANDNEGDTSFLVALHRRDGKPAWRVARKTFPKRGAYSCPVLYRPQGGAPYLLFTSTAHGLTAVDPATGKVLWEAGLGLEQRCVNTPLVCGDLVFFSGGSGGGGKESAVVRVPKAAGDAPAVAWRMRRAIPYVPSGLVLDDRFFLVSDGGVVSCHVAATGEQVYRGRLEGAFFSSPVTNGKTIYLVSRAGTLFCLASGGKLEVLGTFDLGDKAFATPAIANGRLFVRTFHKLFCFGSAPVKAGKSG